MKAELFREINGRFLPKRPFKALTAIHGLLLTVFLLGKRELGSLPKTLAIRNATFNVLFGNTLIRLI